MRGVLHALTRRVGGFSKVSVDSIVNSIANTIVNTKVNSTDDSKGNSISLIVNSIADSLAPNLLISPWAGLIGSLDAPHGYGRQGWCHMQIRPACIATCDVLCPAAVYSRFVVQ